MARKVLITGGPVAANLDAVKIITNRFKGGRMVGLANRLSVYGLDVTYLASDLPRERVLSKGVRLERHDGFWDYRRKVLESAVGYDVVVLGAAVANLIPDERWQDLNLMGGKFPSHNYAEDDPVPILFRIAPRIINQVKAKAPRTKLIGFKLLSNVKHETLIKAARLVQKESKANLVIANDAKNLDVRFVVTPEGGWYDLGDLAYTIREMANDEHYKTSLIPAEDSPAIQKATDVFKRLVDDDRYRGDLMDGIQPDGMIFGCVATRIHSKEGGFIISQRGKKRLEDYSMVSRVDHDERIVVASLGKASLNAPLIDRIFQRFPEANVVVHWHPKYDDGLTKEWLSYAQPGTVRDSIRNFDGALNKAGRYRFGIVGHGLFEVSVTG